MNWRAVNTIVMSVMAVVMMMLAGCAGGQETEAVTETESIKGIGAMIASGTIYEITEDNFVEGLYHNLTQEEIGAWADVLSRGTYTCKEGTITPEESRYMLEFYDEAENNLVYIRVNSALELCFDDRYLVYGDEIDRLIAGLVDRD